MTSDAVGRAFIEALSRCAARGINVCLRADHAGCGASSKARTWTGCGELDSPVTIHAAER